MARDGLARHDGDEAGLPPEIASKIGSGTGQVKHPPAILARLWGRQAGQGLARIHPELSARSGLSQAQVITLGLTGLVLAIGTAVWPAALAGLAGLACCVLFSLGILLRIAAASSGASPHPRRPVRDRDLPRLSIIIALYREAAVIPHLLRALRALDYPVDRLEIRLAIESDDEATSEALAGHHLPPHVAVITVPTGLPRTKPRALNYALRFCSGEIIAIFDAEDRPAPAQPRIAAESFAAGSARLACLQAPLNWYNRDTCWMTRQFALEYAAHFQVLLPFYAKLGWPLPLGGTSNYFRASALRRAGGWDPHNVTEDADLGFRLHRLGYRCDVIAPQTLEEAPTRLRPWVYQRTRWLKGYVQTLAVHARRPGALTRTGGLSSLCLTLGLAALSALAHAPLAVMTLMAIGLGHTHGLAALLAGLILVAGYAASAWCARIGMQRAGLRTDLPSLASMPAYWPLQTLAMARALWQLLHNPFFWDKTEHGISPAPTRSCISPCPPPSSHSASVSASSCWRDGNRVARPDRSVESA